MGMSRKKLAETLQISMNTLKAIDRGEGVRPDTARRLANHLKCQIPDLLSPNDSYFVAPEIASGPMAGASEWERQEPRDQGRLASNGLFYIACGMKHRFTANRSGRGKFYHLSLMNPQIRKTILDKLSRHADVCVRVGLHPHVAHNLTSTPTEGDAGWWVIDDWVGEHTVADRLEFGPWPANQLPRLLLNVALGLQALHHAEVIFRELAPTRVLISDQNGTAVLTDFELAKLLDGSPSVSSDWPEDPYRAPEVDGGSATIQSDFYSFGKLAVAAAAGELVDHDSVADIFHQVKMPARLAKLLIACLEPVPSKRPRDLTQILKDLTTWHEKVKP